VNKEDLPPPTNRLRAWGWFVVVFELTYGLSLALAVDAHRRKTSHSYHVLRSVMPIRCWGAVFVIAALASVYYMLRPTDTRIRFTILGEGVLAVLWATGFLAAAVTDGGAPLAFLPWVAIALKDFIAISTPNYGPLEEAAQAMVDEGD
jgi:hypothetical protein